MSAEREAAARDAYCWVPKGRQWHRKGELPPRDRLPWSIAAIVIIAISGALWAAIATLWAIL